MNIKSVLRVYGQLRQLTDDESALLTTLRNLNDSEREQLVESLAPTKGTGKGIKKTRKPRAKSAHQQSLSSAIQRAPKGKVQGDDETWRGLVKESFEDQCLFVINNATGETCNAVRGDPIHDTTYLSSHEFQPGRSQAATGD